MLIRNAEIEFTLSEFLSELRIRQLNDTSPEWNTKQTYNMLKIPPGYFVFADDADIDFKDLKSLSRKLHARNDTA